MSVNVCLINILLASKLLILQYVGVDKLLTALNVTFFRAFMFRMNIWYGTNENYSISYNIGFLIENDWHL